MSLPQFSKLTRAEPFEVVLHSAVFRLRQEQVGV